MKIEINKYKSLEAENEAGQKADGTWYCKSLKFKNAEDLITKGSEVNQALNTLNQAIPDKKPKIEKIELKKKKN